MFLEGLSSLVLWVRPGTYLRVDHLKGAYSQTLDQSGKACQEQTLQLIKKICKFSAKQKFHNSGPRGRIFSCVQPFYERSMSDLEPQRSMHRPVQVAHSRSQKDRTQRKIQPQNFYFPPFSSCVKHRRDSNPQPQDQQLSALPVRYNQCRLKSKLVLLHS